MSRKSRSKIYHIQYTDFGDSQHVTAIGMTGNSAFYFRRNFEHHFKTIGDKRYIVTSNVWVTSEQALFLAQAHFDGRFDKYDTGDFD